MALLIKEFQSSENRDQGFISFELTLKLTLQKTLIYHNSERALAITYILFTERGNSDLQLSLPFKPTLYQNSVSYKKSS